LKSPAFAALRKVRHYGLASIVFCFSSATYIHTSNERLRDAVRKRDKIDYNSELEKIFESVELGRVNQQEFNDQIKKLFKF